MSPSILTLSVGIFPLPYFRMLKMLILFLDGNSIEFGWTHEFLEMAKYFTVYFHDKYESLVLRSFRITNTASILFSEDEAKFEGDKAW